MNRLVRFVSQAANFTHRLTDRPGRKIPPAERERFIYDGREGEREGRGSGYANSFCSALPYKHKPFSGRLAVFPLSSRAIISTISTFGRQ